jgi:hypothetical protein
MSKEHVRLLAVGLAAVTALWATSVFALYPDTLWTRTYGGTLEEYGVSVQRTSDGGYVIGGWTASFGAGLRDAYLIKTDAIGEMVWTRTYGGRHNEWGHSVQQTSDGGYIIAGETGSFGAGRWDAYIVKTGAGGDTLWTRVYGDTLDDGGYSVQQTTDGGYIVAGYTHSFGPGDADVYLIKTDASGDTVWTRTYGGTGVESAESVQQTSDGGYVIAGYTDSFGAVGHDVYLIKTDASGDTVWTRRYGGTGWERGHSVQQTSDGGYIIAGYTDSFGAGQTDVYLIKTGAEGETLWTRTFGGANWERGNSVQQTTDGGYIIGGWTSSFGAGSNDVYLIRTDASGDTVWTRTYGGTGAEEGHSIQQTARGRYIIGGWTSSFGAGQSDFYLIRLKEGRWKVKEEKLPLPPTPGRGNGELVVGFGNEVSGRLALRGSTPNPCSQGTVIRFHLPEQGEINLSIHDVQGRLVRELVGEVRPLGSNSVAWDGRDFTGAEVPVGIYFVRLEAGSKVATSKVVVAH